LPAVSEAGKVRTWTAACSLTTRLKPFTLLSQFTSLRVTAKIPYLMFTINLSFIIMQTIRQHIIYYVSSINDNFINLGQNSWCLVERNNIQ